MKSAALAVATKSRSATRAALRRLIRWIRAAISVIWQKGKAQVGQYHFPNDPP
jgi:hypothetical protein